MTAAHVSAVMTAAARHGVWLSPPAAAAIAQAVLEHADDRVQSIVHIAPEMMTPVVLTEARKRLRRQLAYEIAEAGFLPTALAQEKIIDHRVPWEPVMIEWIVPVRHP